MCLNKISKKKIANKDIVCYKRLEYIGSLKDIIIGELDNKPFTAIINGCKCDGIISIYNGEVYLCQNELNGMPPCDTKGFRFGWRFDQHVKSLIIDGEEIITLVYVTPYQKADVKLGDTYTSDIMVHDDDTISKGLHSYTSWQYAKHFAYPNEVLAKCIIPKKSYYYTGDDGRAYASNALKYIGIIQHESNE